MLGGNARRPSGAVAGLADAVQALRAQLTTAMAAAEDESMKFELEAVTMEFGVEITADTSAKGGLRFWVVELGASHKRGRSATHTVTLEMKPHTKKGRKPEISAEVP
jgi:hypothetical protein